ncbi:hypothetical protein BV898_14210 [Hypsibius exemplaris]|uniref:Apextrin C-terminal domain-containing protein n=1 Tax=Hypsibius exemplaris TaxID=2072580 RepID=A0A1W0W8E9_HYPEX|nr:hypothetical protein BV898_14210 [Hypsibius exemplaris]
MLWQLSLLVGVSVGSAAASSCWPQENFILIQPQSGCPDDNWVTGSVTNTLHKNSSFPEDLVNGTVNGEHVTTRFCAHSKDQKCDGTAGPANFPKGTYCLWEYEPKRRTRQRTEEICPVGFQWSWMNIDDINAHNANSHEGPGIPLAEYFSHSTVPYFCCRDDGEAKDAIELPTDKDFILLPTMAKKTCQEVKGMTVKKTSIYYSTSDEESNVHGAPTVPDSTPPEYSYDVVVNNWGRGMHLAICYYSQGPHVAKTNKLAEPPAAPAVAPVCWPKDDFVLLQAKSGCPSEGSWSGETRPLQPLLPSSSAWEPGTVRHIFGPKTNIPAVSASTSVNGVTTLKYCKHQGKRQPWSCNAQNSGTFGLGSYCFFLGSISDTGIFDHSCPAGFNYNWVVLDNIVAANETAESGGVPEGEYYHASIVYYTCCRNDGDVKIPINLPTKDPFILMPTMEGQKGCQAVNGMKVDYLNMFLDTGDMFFIPMLNNATWMANDYHVYNPAKGHWGPQMDFKICYYSAK